MRFLGNSSYPVHWTRYLQVVSLLSILIILEGIATLIWLLVDPSEPGSRVFLAYSLEKWILILASILVISVFVFILWVIRSKPGWIETGIKVFEWPRYAGGILIFSTLLFVGSTGLMVWMPRIDTIQPYYQELLPFTLWGTAIVTQGWISLVALMWQPITKTAKIFFPLDREQQIYPTMAASKYLFIIMVALSLAYLILQVKNYLNVREAVLIGDSWSYLQGASLDWNDPAFFSERRPWAILLIFKLLGSSQVAIGIFQLVLSTSAWLFLAWVFVGSLQNQWGKLIGFFVTLVFSFSPTVQLWNHTVLSESLSISLLILILALFVRLSQQWKWRYLFWLSLSFVLWMSFREANTYIALFVAIALLGMGFVQRTFRVYWIVSFLIGMTFLVNYQLSSVYALPRWALPLAEVITHRILPNPEYLEFFTDNGMPTPRGLMALSGRNANSDDFAIINNSELKGFSRWLFNDARNVYVRFLLAHPGYTIASPLVNIQVLLGYDYHQGVPIPDYLPALPDWVNGLFYPVGWFWPYVWLSIFAIGYVFAVNLRSKRRLFWIILAFLLLAVPQLYLIWHGDALDVERHAVVMNIQIHLGIWWMVLFQVDSFLANRKA